MASAQLKCDSFRCIASIQAIRPACRKTVREQPPLLYQPPGSGFACQRPTQEPRHNLPMNRRRVLTQAFLAGPAAILANAAQADRPQPLQKPSKVTGIEVLYLEKPLKERFWMANAPIGGYQP